MDNGVGEPAWPPRVAPMLATARSLPAGGAGYGWEWKWDGVRVSARVRADGEVRLDSRNDKDMTSVFPETADALAETFSVARSGWMGRSWRWIRPPAHRTSDICSNASARSVRRRYGPRPRSAT